MGVIRPRTGSSTGGRWVLYKHGDFRREFVINGAIDFTAETTFTDQDGDEWAVDGGGATTFALQSGGVRVDTTNPNEVNFSINPKSIIPGLKPADPLWFLFRVTNITIPMNLGVFRLRLRRNTTPGMIQAGGWVIRRDVIQQEMNPFVNSAGVDDEKTNVESFADTLFSVNVSGLLWEYRKQSTSTDFPTTPEPDDIPIFSIPTTFNGRYSSQILTDPVGEDIDLANEVLQFSSNPGVGSSAQFTVSDIWLYRFE